GEELPVGRPGEARGGGEGVRVAGALAEALDQAVADREGGEERDLLRGDRGDDRLERVRRDRRAEPGEAADELPEHGIARREVVGRGDRQQRHVGATLTARASGRAAATAQVTQCHKPHVLPDASVRTVSGARSSLVTLCYLAGGCRSPDASAAATSFRSANGS